MYARAIVMSLALALASVGPLLPSVAAQAETAPHLSPEANTLWAHTSGDTHWINTLKDDPSTSETNTNDPNGEDAGGQTATSANQAYKFTLPLNPALEFPVILDKTKKIEITAYIGGGAYTVGRVSMSTTIKLGTETVASGSSQTHTMTPAQANENEDYNKITWSLTPQLERLEPGADLVWTVEGSGTWNNMFMSTGENRGRTNLVFPVLAVEETLPDLGLVPVIVENLTGEEVHLELDFNETTNATYEYNWTTNATDLVLEVGGNLTNGTANVTVLDGNLTEVANATFSAGENATVQPISGAVEGNWTIRVDLENVTGNLTVLLGVPAPPPVLDNETASPAADNATDEADSAIPGPGLWAVGLAVLGGLVVARRRRA